MKVVSPKGKQYEVTEKAFEVVYKSLGYTEYVPPKRKKKTVTDDES